MRASKRHGEPTQKPIHHRLYGCLAVICVIFAAADVGAQAMPTLELTDAAVVAGALDDPALAKLSTAERQRFEAQAVRARTWSNPELGFAHEQLLGSGAEDTIVLRQVLRLSGRYQLLADAARTLAEAERLGSAADRWARAATVRREFYALLAAERRLAIYEEWLTLMEQVDEELRKRVEAGESAPYERLRLQKEVADIEAVAARDRAERTARQRHLAQRMELPPGRAADVSASGELMPGDLPADAALRDAVLARPDIAAADRRIEAADLMQRSARQWWVPEPEVEAGYKTAGDSSAREHGFVVGLSVTLPFMAQTKAERIEADALKLAAEGERELTIRDVSAEVLGLAERIRALALAAEAYEQTGVATATKVVETARLAYGAGELGILELIDGYRGLVEARLTVVQIAAEAREHEIALWHALAATEEDSK